MNLSIFDVVGPVMIGPSSSHTAGAARLARIARQIAARKIRKVEFGLSGSFAQTYKGHGSDRALIAGVLGFSEDDERIVDAFAFAEESGLDYSFVALDLEEMHENSVQFRFTLEDDEICVVAGSSIGGAQIVITRIGEYHVELTAQAATLLIRHLDRRGLISTITSVLALNDCNIATMRLSRHDRGGSAFTVIETDGKIPENTLDAIAAIPGVLFAQAIDPEQEAKDDGL